MPFLKTALGTIVLVFFTMLFPNIIFAKAKHHDGEIIAYMQAINNTEINVAKVAKDKKVDAEVMKYADMMIEQHSSNLQQITDLSNQSGIKPDETSAVKKFEKKSDTDLTKLSKLDAAPFQKAYIKAMIKDHTKVNEMLTHFSKEADNKDLKQYLVNTKKVVEEHLMMAKQLK